jgi:hypothetical protein
VRRSKNNRRKKEIIAKEEIKTEDHKKQRSVKSKTTKGEQLNRPKTQDSQPGLRSRNTS